MAEFFRFSDGAVKREPERGWSGLAEESLRNLSDPVKNSVKDLVIGAAISLSILWILPTCLSWLVMAVVSMAILASFFAGFVSEARRRVRFVEARRKAVLITGCDTGFGRLLAKRLDEKGFHVFACCLYPDKPEAKSLKESSSSRLHVVGMDVTKNEDVDKAFEYVAENIGTNKLWAVVCNAGIHGEGEFLWTSRNHFHKMVDTNYMGTVRVAKAFLPLLCRSKGRVVAVASAAGRVGLMGMVGYCSTKSAIITFCDSLRMEMYKFGVQVVTVEPHLFRTAINDETLMSENAIKRWSETPADVQALHPPDYLDNYIRMLCRLINRSNSYNLQEVLTCLEEAVAAENPKFCYVPGTRTSRIETWMLNKLPKAVKDYFITKGMMKI